MLCGDIYAKRKNRLGSGHSTTVSSYSKGDGSSQGPHSQLSPSCQRPVGLSLQTLTSTCPVLCAMHWSCLQGWFDQSPASCWVPRGRSIISGLYMCHPGIQNHRCGRGIVQLPPLVFSTTVTHHKFVLFVFNICLRGFWGNPSKFAESLSMGCVV